MPIERVEEVVYGVADVAACCRFCTDFGLAAVVEAADRPTFRTAENQRVVLRAMDADDLPTAVSPEPGVREIIWGVSSSEDLDRIADRFAGRAVRRDTDGSVHSTDETGFAIGFRVIERASAIQPQRLTNTYGNTERRNAGLAANGRAAPRRIVHVALDLPKEGHQEARRLYIDLLGFKPVEDILPTGVFLQCEAEEDHHQLFLCHRTDRPGTNHVAFEVQDFDEVIEGGNYLVEQGWKEVRRLGRHTVGSNLFRFFTAPMGGRVEYATDMDKVGKSHPTRVWDTSPQHHLWTIRSNAD